MYSLPFQFTHPVRGATDSVFYDRESAMKFQFTHPVRGATATPSRPRLRLQVSIHAPRAGCDLVRLDSHARLEVFQFTHPVRGATAQGRRNLCSLHCFNSRTPCGVRRRATEATRTAVAFQFTHPVRGATFLFNRAGVALPVSIHAPRAGCDGAA